MFKNFTIIGLLIVVFFMVYMRTKSGFEAVKVAQDSTKMGACPYGSELVGNMCLSRCTAEETTVGNVCQTKWSIKQPFIKVRPRISSTPIKTEEKKVDQGAVKMDGKIADVSPTATKRQVVGRPVHHMAPRQGNLVCPPGQYLSQNYCYRRTSGLGPQSMGRAEREMICSVPNFTTVVNGRCYGGCPAGYGVNPNDAKSCLLNGAKA